VAPILAFEIEIKVNLESNLYLPKKVQRSIEMRPGSSDNVSHALPGNKQYALKEVRWQMREVGLAEDQVRDYIVCVWGGTGRTSRSETGCRICQCREQDDPVRYAPHFFGSIGNIKEKVL
jgi:hypothetical protein